MTKKTLQQHAEQLQVLDRLKHVRQFCDDDADIIRDIDSKICAIQSNVRKQENDIWNFIHSMDPYERIICTRHYLLGWSWRQIAQKMNQTRDSVRATAKRALRKYCSG